MVTINKVAVLGAGVMGSTIAAHLANAGLSVRLLDMIPPKQELGKVSDRNQIAKNALKALTKIKPAALFLKEIITRIEPGNFEDDIEKIKDCDWVIEVIVENIKIKIDFFTNNVIPNLGNEAILSSNTSGLSVNKIAEQLPESIRKRFLVTHFFNPPRYMRLMELIPCQYTEPSVLEGMATFTSKHLGKVTVYAKDTPNFIANRIGVFSICNSIQHMIEMKLTVEEVDVITGPATARAKSATFRTADLVGLDTLMHVANNSYELLESDEQRERFLLPDFIKQMIQNGLLGNKTGKGFYKKEFIDGKKQIFYYDYGTSEYLPLKKPKFGSISAIKLLDNPKEKLERILTANDTASEFAWRNLRDTLIYSLNRIPEIADDVVNIDNGIKYGFNWELGPFEMLDVIGLQNFVDRAEKDGIQVPEQLKSIDSFYQFDTHQKLFYDISTGQTKPIPLDPNQINLTVLKQFDKTVDGNRNCSLIDIGDGVYCLEFHSKMNAITGDIMSMIQKSIKRVEKEGVGVGLVIANQGANFSVGANLMLLATALAEGAFEDISLSVKQFQKTSMAIKYSKIPVVAAPFQMTLGGGCEFALHADAVTAHAETYMGLVEVGVGLLPAGGGTKEMAIQAIQQSQRVGADINPFIFKYFENIAMGKVSTSGDELFGMGYLKDGDTVTMNLDDLIAVAKKRAISLAANYRPRIPLSDLPAPGKSVAASIISQLWNMKVNGWITEYESKMATIIAGVITGGDVLAGTLISEEYLLELEREGFLKLCGNKETALRIQHMLKKGKPLRN